MLPAAQRLRRSRDFRATVRQGRRAGSPGGRLVVHLATRDAAPSADVPPSPPSAGIVVSRAVGPAVVRTRVKRRLRHVVRARLGQLAPGSALVVRALPPAAGASSVDLDTDLAAALRRVLRRGSAR